MRYTTTVAPGVYNVWEDGRLLASNVCWPVALAIVQRRVTP